MSAILSPCGTYRYELRRTLAGDGLTGSPLVFCCLNPSTADATTDDATIRRVKAFALRERRTSLLVVNLFALRSREPSALRVHADPVGPDNDAHLVRASAEGGGLVVVAWGALPSAWRSRARAVAELLRGQGAELLCLGMTRDGGPRHPLYSKADAELRPWRGFEDLDQAGGRVDVSVGGSQMRVEVSRR